MKKEEIITKKVAIAEKVIQELVKNEDLKKLNMFVDKGYLD